MMNMYKIIPEERFDLVTEYHNSNFMVQQWHHEEGTILFDFGNGDNGIRYEDEK